MVEAANVAVGTRRCNGDGSPVSVLDESEQQRGDETPQQDDDT